MNEIKLKGSSFFKELQERWRGAREQIGEKKDRTDPDLKNLEQWEIKLEPKFFTEV